MVHNLVEGGSWEIYSKLYDMSLIETMEFRLAGEIIVNYSDSTIYFCERNGITIRAVHGTYKS